MLRITQLENDEAKDKIGEHLLKIGSVHVDYWLGQVDVKCYLGWDDGQLSCFCLLYRMAKDPFGNHKKPYLLSYISTLDMYQKRGYGTQLLSYIQDRDEMMACCESQISFNLFQKCGFEMDEYKKMARYPSTQID